MIAGPNRWTTLRRLFPVPFDRFPDFLRDMTARYGNVFAFALPWRSYVFVNEPAPIKEILVTQQHAFSKSLGTRVLRLLLGQGLLTSEEPLHRQMRRVVQPAFHRERIAEYAGIMERDARDFAERLKPGETFDAHAAMTELTLRIATETLFGSDESDSARVVGDAMRLMMGEFPWLLTPIGSLRARLPFRNTRRFWKARATLDAIIFDLIARRRKDGATRTDALSLLLAARDAETEHRPSDSQVRDEIMTLFIAGHETTANALTWALVLLAQHPEAEERAAAAGHGDRSYIDRVVKEVLRLYPPAWIIGRETLQDVALSGGVTIPARTTVFFAPLLLHRRVEFFAEPERFNPDRWLGADPPPFSYVPFGGGARRCIGEDFAREEIAIVLRALLGRFRFALAADAPIKMAPLVTLRPAGPVWMRAAVRESPVVFSIRHALPTDARQIGEVFDAAVADGWTYMGELARQPLFPPEEWDSVIAEHAPPNALLVAVDEADRVVGFTAVHPKECEMYLLFVHPDHARRGVGRALLVAAHDALQAAGCRDAFLYTHEENKRALAVYEAAGYRRDGTVRESDFRGLHQREPRLVKLL